MPTRQTHSNTCHFTGREKIVMGLPSPTYRNIIQQAWPLMLANIAHPLLGLVDTAIIGNIGSTHELAALALGTLIVNFIYWNFGFLRMSTTAFAAQNTGESNSIALWQNILRASMLALSFGVILVITQTFLINTTLHWINASDHAHSVAKDYLSLRLWGAPITLLHFVVTGLLIGLGETRKLLYLQILLNGINAFLSILLAGYFSLGVKGIAIGTLVAELVVVSLSISIVITLFKKDRQQYNKNDISKSSYFRHITHTLFLYEKMIPLLKSNREIWIRTLFLLGSFFAFTRWSGQFGDNVLSANHILLQLIAFSAFFLDSYANVTESYIGQSIGSHKQAFFFNAYKKSTLLAFITALSIAISLMIIGPTLIAWLTDIEPVVTISIELLPYALLYIACSFLAFQLDGVFIGANATAALRNSSIVSALIFGVMWLVILQQGSKEQLWWAMISYILTRGALLYLQLPKLIRETFQ